MYISQQGILFKYSILNWSLNRSLISFLNFQTFCDRDCTTFLDFKPTIVRTFLDEKEQPCSIRVLVTISTIEVARFNPLK